MKTHRKTEEFLQTQFLLMGSLGDIKDANACNYIEHVKIHPIWRLLMGESQDQPTDKKKGHDCLRG